MSIRRSKGSNDVPWPKSTQNATILSIIGTRLLAEGCDGRGDIGDSAFGEFGEVLGSGTGGAQHRRARRKGITPALAARIAALPQCASRPPPCCAPSSRQRAPYLAASALTTSLCVPALSRRAPSRSPCPLNIPIQPVEAVNVSGEDPRAKRMQNKVAFGEHPRGNSGEQMRRFAGGEDGVLLRFGARRVAPRHTLGRCPSRRGCTCQI